MKMLFTTILLGVLVFSPAVRATDETKDSVAEETESNRQSRQFYTGSYGNPMYYGYRPWAPYFYRYSPYVFPQPSSEYDYPYTADFAEFRSAEPSMLFRNNQNEDELFEDKEVESRQISINQLMANRPFINNPNQATPMNLYDSCVDPNGLAGMCMGAGLCRATGGRPNGVCGLKNVCCVNTISQCGVQATMNNTFWRSPNGFTTGNCDLAINLGNNFYQLRRPICQVRLDFISFNIEQPNLQSVCNLDTFSVRGASGNIPVICGANNGQHMYLNPLTPNGDIFLSMRIGAGTFVRSWNIQIAMLPCGATYLAPNNCLQYFTRGAGSVSSFNYADVTSVVANSPVRQLAGQDYNICFRREVITNQAAARICFTACRPTVAGAVTFGLSGNANNPAAAGSAAANCPNDFLIIPGGTDVNAPFAQSDRYCGTALHPTNANAAGTTVCTNLRDFNILYRTNSAETAADNGNVGFCLDFEERVA